MLYVTTRDRKNVRTSFYALNSECDVTEGLYIPLQFLQIGNEERQTLKEKSFCQCIADVLNMFFSARLDSWDVACCMGTHPLRLVPMSHKITVAEMWNNPEWSLDRFVRNLNGRIHGKADNGCPSNWMEIAVRIAVLHGIIAQLLRIGIVDWDKPIDLAVASGDFATPMAAWYARNMGLPIGTIIISCNENSGTWDLLHHGEVRLNQTVVSTSTPLCNYSMPINMERLILETLGDEEVMRFAQCFEDGSVYNITQEQMECVASGIFGAFVGQKRVETIIRHIYGSGAYILSPYSALAYGGLQDYRSTKGESRQALILTEYGPLYSAQKVANCIGITEEELRNRIRLV